MDRYSREISDRRDKAQKMSAIVRDEATHKTFENGLSYFNNTNKQWYWSSISS